MPELNDAYLEFRGQRYKEEPHESKARLADWPPIILRQDWNYGKELKPGRIEMLSDFPMPTALVRTGNHSFTAEATLPDGRIGIDVYLEGDA